MAASRSFTPLAAATTLAAGSLAFLGLAGGAALAGARRWICPPRLSLEMPGDLPVIPQDVSFLSADGLTRLRGWTLPQPDPATPAIIVCHGYQRSCEEGGMLALDLHRLGYQVLLFDFRACGRSEGRFTTIGYHEVEDLLGAADFLDRHLPAGTPIGVHGFSMGAAVAIMASARTRRIGGVIADSPFATLAGAIDLRLQLEPSRLSSLIQRLTIRMAERLVRVRAADVRPIDHVAAIAPRPLFLIHGTADEVVAVGDSLALYQRAAGPKELWLSEGSSHCTARFDRPQEYLERVHGFFQASFGARVAPA